MNMRLNEVLKINYELLKARDSKNIDSLETISKKYEDFRLATSFYDESQYLTISVKTGRAMSNICYDLMNFGEYQPLEELSSSPSMVGSEVFFLAHRGGLCNRLRAISSLRLLSRKIGLPFSFSWAEIELCNGGPLPHFPLVARLDSLIFRMKNKLSTIFLSDNPLHPWFYYNLLGSVAGYNSWESFLGDYRLESAVLLNDIISSSADAGKVNEVLNQISKVSYLAVHIRRTDFVEYFSSRFPEERLPAIEDYISWIKRNYPQGGIYVSTDELNVKLEMNSAFGDRVIQTEHRYDTDSVRQTSFQHALLDLSVLSRAQYILPTPRSSFSDYACSISLGKVVNL